MTTQVMQPAGMNDSGLMPSDVDPAQLASPHVKAESGEVMVSPVFPYTRSDAPADALHVTCEDLAKWALVSLQRGEIDGTRILTPESYDTLWKPYSETGWEGRLGAHYIPALAGYGLGWYTGEVDGHRLVGHAGVNPGFNAEVIVAPDDGLAVVGLANWQPVQDVPFPAIWVAIDVRYELLGVTAPE